MNFLSIFAVQNTAGMPLLETFGIAVACVNANAWKFVTLQSGFQFSAQPEVGQGQTGKSSGW